MNYSVRYFRHALALDERRARFRPNVWRELTEGREQELDVDLFDPKEINQPSNSESRATWKYAPPKRDHADVKEVWFAGNLARVNVSALAYEYQARIQMLGEGPILRGAAKVYHSYRCAG